MPRISVIMPVYNAAAYLREAIDSVLSQSFPDFELLIFNDGSTDTSESLILSYSDPRIVYRSNPRNMGLIATLNAATAEAKGEFIARMDNDDICEPDRFMLQLSVMMNDPDAVLVSSPILGITAEGKARDHWPADVQSSTPELIRARLPHENCIAHPTIMIRTAVLREYGYNPGQEGSEDWDLWLRLARDGRKMVKTKEVLLKYRIHPGSMTISGNAARSAQLKSVAVKWRFFTDSAKQLRVNAFVLRTLFTVPRDLAYHFRKRVLPRQLRTIKRLLTIHPSRASREFNALKKALTRPRTHYYFFPYSHLGGAEKVHGQITRLSGHAHPLVLFTGIHDQRPLTGQFGSEAELLHVARALYHPFFSARSRRLLLDAIHAAESPVVFGANNRFLDWLTPRLEPRVFIADLTHDIDYEALAADEDYLAALRRYNARIFVSNAALEKTRRFYESRYFDQPAFERLHLVYNFVDVPVIETRRRWNPPFTVLYVGRDTPEKAVDRVFRLAQMCEKARLPCDFHLVGEIRRRAHPANTMIHGLVTDSQKLAQRYADAHFVIITSRSEGFPLSLMEGMALGCVPLATAVGDIPFHIRVGVNGFTVANGNDASEQIFRLLERFASDAGTLPRISASAADYVATVFSRRQFEESYRRLLRL